MPSRGGRGASGSAHRGRGRGRGGGSGQHGETDNVPHLQRVARPTSVSVGRGGKAAFSHPDWYPGEDPAKPYAAFVGRGSGLNNYLSEARGRKELKHDGRIALAGIDSPATHIGSLEDLTDHLESLDGKQFPAYRELAGREFYFDPSCKLPGKQPRLKLRWVTIQGDPFARASAIEIYLVPQLFGWSYSGGSDSFDDPSHPFASKIR